MLCDLSLLWSLSCCLLNSELSSEAGNEIQVAASGAAAVVVVASAAAAAAGDVVVGAADWRYVDCGNTVQCE